MYAAQPAPGRHATARPAGARAHAAAHDPNPRLTWLVAALAESDRRARLFRDAQEEREMLLMPRPVDAARAFALFGLLLGLLPPAAIFLRLAILFSTPTSAHSPISLLFVPMLFVCALVGRLVGRRVGRTIGEFERGGWLRLMLFTLAAAFGWATLAGAAGGVLFFGVGALFGVFCALAVAVPSFLVFTALHRTLARGGMIDERRLRPLAWGVAAIPAALTLSPSLLPY